MLKTVGRSTFVSSALKTYPEPFKSIMIVNPDNLDSGKRFVLWHGLKVWNRVCCLGIFIGDDKSKREYISITGLYFPQSYSYLGGVVITLDHRQEGH